MRYSCLRTRYTSQVDFQAVEEILHVAPNWRKLGNPRHDFALISFANHALIGQRHPSDALTHVVQIYGLFRLHVPAIARSPARDVDFGFGKLLKFSARNRLSKYPELSVGNGGKDILFEIEAIIRPCHVIPPWDDDFDQGGATRFTCADLVDGDMYLRLRAEWN